MLVFDASQFLLILLFSIVNCNPFYSSISVILYTRAQLYTAHSIHSLYPIPYHPFLILSFCLSLIMQDYLHLLYFFFATLTLAEPLKDQIVIPAVQHAISEQLSRFSKYTSYSGTATIATLPTAQVSQVVNAIGAAVTPEARLAQAVAAPPAATTPFPYWYESIPHQGRAAFNPNTNYVVYRNVKSYGAKGYLIPIPPHKSHPPKTHHRTKPI